MYCEQYILSKEKRWQQQVCHQLEKTYPVYPMQPFKNGEFTFNKIYLEERQLYVQLRAHGRMHIFAFLCQRTQRNI